MVFPSPPRHKLALPWTWLRIYNHAPNQPNLLVSQNIKDLRRPKKPLRVSDAPRESQTGVIVSQWGLSRYFAPPESESQEFSMRCYGIYNLPYPMRTFLTLKTTEDVKQNRRARSGTPTTPSTCNYTWSDALVVNLVRSTISTKQGRDRSGSNLILASSVSEATANANAGSTSITPTRAGLFLSLVDYLTKTHIAKCVIPVEAILPGEQYNFAIVINNEGTCLYVSLSLEPSLQFQTNLFQRHPDLCSLEVLLHGVQRIRPPSVDLPDPFPSNSYLAVLHFESDLRKYIKSIATDPPKLPCQQIRLDNPSAFDSLIPSAYRISPPSAPSLYPQWNCLFELTQSLGDVFAPNAVLIVEVFEMNVPRDSQGSVDFIAWTSIPLAELAQPGIRDGTIARHTSLLHMNAPFMGVVEEPCEMASDCAPHEFSMLIEMRRWSSRYYLRQKPKLTSMGGSSSTLDSLVASNSSFLNSSNPSVHQNLSHSTSVVHSPGALGEGGESRIGMGHLQHPLLLHNPPPQPPPRIFIDPQHNMSGIGISSLGVGNGAPNSTNPLILIDYPSDPERSHLSRSSSSITLGEEEDGMRSFEESDDSDEDASDDSLISVDHDHIYGRARSASRIHQTPRNLPRTGSMPPNVHEARNAYANGTLSVHNNGLLSHSHAGIIGQNDDEEDENDRNVHDGAGEEYSAERTVMDELDENGAYLPMSGVPHPLLDTISEATEPALEEALSGLDVSIHRTTNSSSGKTSSEQGAGSSRRDSSEFAAESSVFSGTAPSSGSETWSASSAKHGGHRSSLPPGSSAFSAPMLSTQLSAEQLLPLSSSHSSTSPLSPRSGANPLRVSIPTLGPFNQLGPFSAGAVPTPAPGAGYFGFSSIMSPLSPDLATAPSKANFTAVGIPSAATSPAPIRMLTPTSPPILSPGSFSLIDRQSSSHATIPHIGQGIASLTSSSSSAPAGSDFATPTRPRRPSILKPGTTLSLSNPSLSMTAVNNLPNSGSTGSASPSVPHQTVHSLVTPKRTATSIALPDIDSPEAERNRRVLELRMAELELDTTPESPEKRVLASVLPQVRHMVMRSTTSLAKATLAEQKINSLQAENLALKRQLLKLLAARKEDETSTRSAPSPARPGRKSVGKSATVVSVSSHANPSTSPSTHALASTATSYPTPAVQAGASVPSPSSASSPPPSSASLTSPLSSTDISPASTGEVSNTSSGGPIVASLDPPVPSSTPSNGVLTPLATSVVREVQMPQLDAGASLKSQEVPVVIASSPDPPGSPLSSASHPHVDLNSDSSGISLRSSSSALLQHDSTTPLSPVSMPRAASSAAVIHSSSSGSLSKHAHSTSAAIAAPTSPRTAAAGTPSSPIHSPRRFSNTSVPSSLPTSSSSPQLSTGSKRMTSSSPTAKSSSPTPGISGNAIEFGPGTAQSPSPPLHALTHSAAINTSNTLVASGSPLPSPGTPPERPEKPLIPPRSKLAPGSTSRAGSSASSSSYGSKESEIELLKEEISSWIDLSDKAAKDHQRAAEIVAAKVTDDFVTHIASGIERLKNESAIAILSRNEFWAKNGAHTATSSTPGSVGAATPSTTSSAHSSEDPHVMAELKFELDKLKGELEQYQRKYLLTSAAFGEEVLLLRSKLKERKHQLQEAKKFANSLVASAASSPLHTSHMHPGSVVTGSAPQTPHSPLISHPGVAGLAPHPHSHLSHSGVHAHHPHPSSKHYIALSPISVPPQPAWIASMNAAASIPTHTSLASPANNAAGASSSTSSLNASNSVGASSMVSGIQLGNGVGGGSSAPALTNLSVGTSNTGALGNTSLGSPLGAPQQVQFSPQASSKQPMARRGSISSAAHNGLTIFLDDALPSLGANSSPQLTASGNVMHRDMPLKSPRNNPTADSLTFSSFPSPLQSPGLAHVPPPFESQNSTAGSAKIPRG